MKKLSLKINTENLILGGEDKDKSPIELCVAVIKNVILSFGSQQRGFQEEDRRKYYKISDALAAAIKEGVDEIELEDDWVGFMRKCFRESTLIPNPLLRAVEDLIQDIKDR